MFLFFCFCFLVFLGDIKIKCILFLTFHVFVDRLIVPGPRWVAMSAKVPQFQITYGESNDGGFIQLACDCGW